jgi:3-isopropylmalate dehydrogenase
MASDTLCCAQAQHGSAPSIAGQDVANPTSMILSVAMLVRWLASKRDDAELRQLADSIERAVDRALENPETRTRDIGGSIGCAAFADAVIDTLSK